MLGELLVRDLVSVDVVEGVLGVDADVDCGADDGDVGKSLDIFVRSLRIEEFLRENVVPLWAEICQCLRTVEAQPVALLVPVPGLSLGIGLTWSKWWSRRVTASRIVFASATSRRSSSSDVVADPLYRPKREAWRNQ